MLKSSQTIKWRRLSATCRPPFCLACLHLSANCLLNDLPPVCCMLYAEHVWHMFATCPSDPCAACLPPVCPWISNQLTATHICGRSQLSACVYKREQRGQSSTCEPAGQGCCRALRPNVGSALATLGGIRGALPRHHPSSKMRWMRGCHGNGTQGPGRLCCPAWHPMDGCLLSPTARGHVPPGGAARGLLRTSRCQLEEAPLAPPRTSSRFTTPF